MATLRMYYFHSLWAKYLSLQPKAVSYHKNMKLFYKKNMTKRNSFKIAVQW